MRLAATRSSIRASRLIDRIVRYGQGCSSRGSVMVVTIFRNRLKAQNVDEYYKWAAEISALAKTMPGYVSHKTFTADDGERVTIVEFADEASQHAWSTQMRHVEAKK